MDSCYKQKWYFAAKKKRIDSDAFGIQCSRESGKYFVITALIFKCLFYNRYAPAQPTITHERRRSDRPSEQSASNGNESRNDNNKVSLTLNTWNNIEKKPFRFIKQTSFGLIPGEETIYRIPTMRKTTEAPAHPPESGPQGIVRM